MVVTKGIEIRLFPTKGQANMFNKNIGAARFAFNTMLRVKEEMYRNYGISFDPKWWLLKEDFPWMAEVDSRAINSAHQNVNKAYQNWFRNLKKGVKKGHPAYKKKSNRGSYTSTNMPTIPEKLFRAGGIFIPKVGVVKFKAHRDFTDIKKIRNLTIKRNANGKYFCSICCDEEVNELEKTGAMIGLDFGIKDLVIASDGEKFENNKFSKREEVKIKRLQKRLSREKKGGKNREKTRFKLAAAHEKLGNKRRDYLHKMTRRLVEENDVICIEDLNVKGMMKNHRLAGSIADASFREIRRQLAYKCKWYGKTLVVIDRWSPTSKTCSDCGFKMENFGLGIREWDCPNCHIHHDRDVNAARNILNEGLKILTNRGGRGASLLSRDKVGAPLTEDNPIGQELCACSTEAVELCA